MKEIENEYLLFAGSSFYPSGGWDDFKGYFHSIEDAQIWLNSEEYYEWAHIVFQNKIIFWGYFKSTIDPKWIWRDEE